MSGEPTFGTTGSEDHGDLVESEPREIGAGRRWLVGCLVVALVILAPTVRYLDGRRRTDEFRALLGCVATAEGARAYADATVTAMASYVRPTVGAGPSPTLQLGLYELVAAQAASGEPSVRQALAQCRGVRVLSFHPGLRAAHAAYVACLQAEVDRLVATASDGSRAFAGSDGLTRLRTQALEELSVAAPDERARLVAERLMNRR